MISYDNSVIVIDDFYSDPDSVREFALSLDYTKDENQNICGLQSPNLHLEILLDRFQSIVKAEKVSFDRDNWVFGAFRLAKEGELGLSYVHFDASDWSGVVYLSDEPETEGTLFFKHKQSGLIGPTSELRRTKPWEEIRDDGVAIINGNSKNLDAWELTTSVDLKYNRLVLFRGRNLFHAPGKAFGTDIKNSRLTQHFFFDVESA